MADTRKFQLLIRKLHVYVGLFFFGFLLVFTVSAFTLNHRWRLWDVARNRVEISREVECKAPEKELDKLALGQYVSKKAGVYGEIRSVFVQPERSQIEVVVYRPGYQANLLVDTAKGIARVKESHMNGWILMMNLHTLTGLHSNLQEKRNWLPTHLWSLVMDLTVLAVLFLLGSGLYLWLQLAHLRRMGLCMLGIGFASLLALVFGALR